MAAAGEVATGDIRYSIVFMAFFGNYVSMCIRQRIRKAYPLIVTMMACLLMLRGMGIPFVSPKADAGKKAVLSCCAKPS
jgi:hypothetical protein